MEGRNTTSEASAPLRPPSLRRSALKRVSPPHRRVERDPSRSPAWVGPLASCSASVGLVRRTSRVHALRHRREPGLTGWRREARRPWGTGRNTLRYGEGDKRGRNGPCVIFRLALTSSETMLGADRAWWSDWSSKPAGVLLDLGRFDSYTLPPRSVLFVSHLRDRAAGNLPQSLSPSARHRLRPVALPLR